MVTILQSANRRRAGDPTCRLKGLRVLEIGALPAASYCARIFADFGADVLKIEPVQGDPGCRFRPCRRRSRARRRRLFRLFEPQQAQRNAGIRPAQKLVKRLRSTYLECDVLVGIRSMSSSTGRPWGRLPGGVPSPQSRHRDDLDRLSFSGERGRYRGFGVPGDAFCRALAGLVYWSRAAAGPPVPIPDYDNSDGG